MATVTGTLKDFTPQPLGTSAQAQLVFTPTGPAGSSTKSLLVSQEIRVDPAADGSFTVQLATYGATNPSTAYRLRVEWLDTGADFPVTEEIPWLIVVTGDGELVDFFANVAPGKLLVKGDKGDRGTDGNALQQAAIDALTAKNGEQDGRLNAVESTNANQNDVLTSHGTRLGQTEQKNSNQDERLDRNEAASATRDGRLASLEAVAPKVSNMALDTDGTPIYSPGATQVHVIQDPDGKPYFITFMSARLDADGTPYFA